MSKRLFVGGLSFGTSEDSLKTAFSEAGTIESVAIITDRDTGRSKGFGFVEVATDAEAEQVISKFNGQELDGRKLNVNIARPREERKERSFTKSY